MVVRNQWDDILKMQKEKNCQLRILYLAKLSFKNKGGGFPGGAVVKSPPANAGDSGSSPAPGRSHMPQSN